MNMMISYQELVRTFLSLGRFDEIADAINARRKAEDLYYGEFAASKGGLCEKARQ
ncbi:hypothetical protein ACK986_26150 [Klebsiella pneumoniae]|uniref:hypothetical protein n=1 Tax=Klebsiella pneumoniae TaxID=573 RepID=UPI0039DF4EF3